jgi:hypothetical protein
MGLRPIEHICLFWTYTETPSRYRSYRRYYEPLRHPSQPGLSLTRCQLIHAAITTGTSFACLPSLIPRQVGWNLFARTLHLLGPSPKPGRLGSCISLFEACSAFTHVTDCMLAANATFYTEGFSSFVACAAASIATGRRIQSPGGVYPRCGPHLFTAHPVIRVTRQVERKSLNV